MLALAPMEEDIAERRRIEDDFIKTHPNPSGLKQTLLARRDQLLLPRD